MSRNRRLLKGIIEEYLKKEEIDFTATLNQEKAFNNAGSSISLACFHSSDKNLIVTLIKSIVKRLQENLGSIKQMRKSKK